MYVNKKYYHSQVSILLAPWGWKNLKARYPLCWGFRLFSR